jgi:hypothetical protein
MHEKSSKYMDLEDEDSDEDMTSGNYKTQASPLDPITATSTTVLSALPAVPSTFSNSPFGSSRVPVSLPLASAPPNSWTFGSGYSGVGCSSKLDSRILSSRGGTEGISFPVPRSDALTLSTARSFLPSPTSSRTQRLKLPPSAVSKQPLEPATQIFKAYSEKDNRGQTDIYQNIGFMPEHKGMSMEELRLADYDRDWKFGKDTKIQ